jgi:predicted permease
MIARLAPGATLAEAQSQIDAHDASIAHSYPRPQMMADAGFKSVVALLHADHVRSIRPTLLLMQTGALFLLVIGMVNLINLLLIRASSRAREFAIRQSIGATRRHVIGEVMIETVTLCTLGGIAGTIVAAFGIDVLDWLGASRLPLGAHIVFDAYLAAIGLSCAIVLGAVIAVPVAWLNLRVHLAHALQSASRGMTAGRTAQTLRHAFIVTQIALAFVLLTGAGLLVVSLQRALAVSPGFQPDHVISGQLSLPWKTYRESAALLSFAERLGEQIRQQPGVSAAGVVTNLPLSGNSGKSAVIVKGHVVRPGESVRGHYTYGIIGDYFAAMGIPLQKGRLLGTDDSRRAERVCVVDEDFVHRYWPTGDAIGQRLFQGAGDKPDSEAFTVVGVVGAVKQAEITESAALGTVYFPLKYRSDLSLFLVARAAMRPATLGPVVQGIVRHIDPELPVNDLRSMETRIADSLIARRSPALLSAIFSGLALLLAAIGTYGVLSYAVAQRQREIGIRVALGALPRQIRDQFLSAGFRLLAVGTVLGGVGAALAGRAMQTVLFDVPALHAPTLIATATIMTAVSLLACWLPARRATKVDPMTALRAE